MDARAFVVQCQSSSQVRTVVLMWCVCRLRSVATSVQQGTGSVGFGTLGSLHELTILLKDTTKPIGNLLIADIV